MAEISQDEYAALEALIASDDSPVGIDAKKTHILILHALRDIQRRLDRLEAAAGIADENRRPRLEED